MRHEDRRWCRRARSRRPARIACCPSIHSPANPVAEDVVTAVVKVVRCARALHSVARAFHRQRLVQVEVYTDVEVHKAMLQRAEGGAEVAEEEAPRPRRDADDGTGEGLPPLTVRDGTGTAPGVMAMPEEIVQWTMRHMERNGVDMNSDMVNVNVQGADLVELNALMRKYNLSDNAGPLQTEAGPGGGALQFVVNNEPDGAGGGVSSRGTLSKSNGPQSNGASPVPARGGPPAAPVTQSVVRVGVPQGGLGALREGIMVGARPQPAVTLASSGAEKSEVTVMMFPGDSGDILLSHFSFTIRAGAQQVRAYACASRTHVLGSASCIQSVHNA